MNTRIRKNILSLAATGILAGSLIGMASPAHAIGMLLPAIQKVADVPDDSATEADNNRQNLRRTVTVVKAKI